MRRNVWAFYSLFHVRFSKYFKPHHPGDNAKRYYIFFYREIIEARDGKSII